MNDHYFPTSLWFTFKRLPLELPLTEETVKQTVLAVPETQARTRQRVAKMLGALCRFAEIDFDPAKYKGEYSAKSVDPRSLHRASPRYID